MRQFIERMTCDFCGKRGDIEGHTDALLWWTFTIPSLMGKEEKHMCNGCYNEFNTWWSNKNVLAATAALDVMPIGGDHTVRDRD